MASDLSMEYSNRFQDIQVCIRDRRHTNICRFFDIVLSKYFHEKIMRDFFLYIWGVDRIMDALLPVNSYSALMAHHNITFAIISSPTFRPPEVMS